MSKNIRAILLGRGRGDVPCIHTPGFAPVKLWENNLLPCARVQGVKQPVVGPLFKKNFVSIATRFEELDFWPLFLGYSIRWPNGLWLCCLLPNGLKLSKHSVSIWGEIATHA